MTTPAMPATTATIRKATSRTRSATGAGAHRRDAYPRLAPLARRHAII
jgi:hypothetical protein